MSKHRFKCVSAGMYDDTMECKNCKLRVTFSADGPEKQRYWEDQECPEQKQSPTQQEGES